jgi:hypothetical protein
MAIVGLMIIFIALVCMGLSIAEQEPLGFLMCVILIGLGVCSIAVSPDENESKQINTTKNEIVITNALSDVFTIDTSNVIIISNKYEMITITRFPQQ